MAREARRSHSGDRTPRDGDQGLADDARYPGRSGVPASVRCRRDPDGVVVWVPVDEADEPHEIGGARTIDDADRIDPTAGTAETAETAGTAEGLADHAVQG